MVMDINLNDLELQLLNLKKLNENFIVAIDNAAPGMVLKEDILYNDNLLLVAGAKLTETSILGLKRRGIKEIKISLEESNPLLWDTDINSTVDVVTYNNIKNSLRNLKDLDSSTIGSLLNDSKKIVEQILMNDKFSYSLADYNASDKNNLASHSVRTCVYSLVLAKAYNNHITHTNKGKINYEDIAIAALLHDAGIACEDDSVRENVDFLGGFGSNYPGLSDEMLRKVSKKYNYRYDPYYAFCMIHNHEEISSAAKSMIFFSRENERGTGSFAYKKMQMAQSNIRLLSPNLIGAEIINLCSSFDAELCTNINKRATLENVQAFITSLIATKSFNLELIELLLKNIPLYPFGTRVQLGGDENSFGVVIENFCTLRDYHRPKVLKVPSNTIIDLRDGKSTIVNQICGKEMRFSDLYINTEILDEVPKR